MPPVVLAACVINPAVAVTVSNIGYCQFPSASGSSTFAATLLDSFYQTGDADDTASLNRAMAACVPVALEGRVYTINNFAVSNATCATFVLRGIKGESVIRRTSASGSSWFNVNSATVFIDGVIFDANKAAVSANQWGVLLNQGGQSVQIQNSAFKNNSGTLGSCLSLLSTGPAAGGWFDIHDNEITGCTFNSLYLGSVTQGAVTNNYIHDNSGFGIDAAAYGTASSTNYLSDVLISDNLIARNSLAGISLGGFAPPYTFGTPSAQRVQVVNNHLQDNGGSTGYELTLQGDYLNAVANQIDQSNTSSSGSVFGGIDCNARYELVSANTITLTGGTYGIDCGGSVGAQISGNKVTMNSGALIDAGGNASGLVEGNTLNASGTGEAVVVYSTEGDGSGNTFPTVTSGLTIRRNSIFMSGTGSRGIQLFDNAGGFSGASATRVAENDFVGSSGASSYYALNYRGSSSSIQEGGNTWNGTSTEYVDPNGSGDVIFDEVFDEVRGYSSTSNVRSIITDYVASYGSGGSILYVYPTSGGTNYTSATVVTVTCTGLTGWTGTPQISGGVIVGVKTTAIGSGCSGTPTAAASDTGGGSGAVLAVGNKATLPDYRKLTWYAQYTPGGSGNLLQSYGGYVQLEGGTVSMYPAGPVALETLLGGLYWNYSSPYPQSYAEGSLPTCNTAATGAQVIVSSGSVVNGWLARCDGTNWRFPNGTVVS